MIVYETIVPDGDGGFKRVEVMGLPDWSSNPASEEIPELEELDYEPPVLTEKEKELLRKNLNRRITGRTPDEENNLSEEAFDRAMKGI